MFFSPNKFIENPWPQQVFEAPDRKRPGSWPSQLPKPGCSRGCRRQRVVPGPVFFVASRCERSAKFIKILCFCLEVAQLSVLKFFFFVGSMGSRPNGLLNVLWKQWAQAQVWHGQLGQLGHPNKQIGMIKQQKQHMELATKIRNKNSGSRRNPLKRFLTLVAARSGTHYSVRCGLALTKMVGKCQFLMLIWEID